MAKTVKTYSFTLTKKCKDMLTELAKQDNVSASEWLERNIRDFYVLRTSVFDKWDRCEVLLKKRIAKLSA